MDGNILKRPKEATLLNIPNNLPEGDAKRMKLVPAASFADVKLVDMKAEGNLIFPSAPVSLITLAL
ncbi:hypothetical protein C8J56DRAFT_1167148, partial [Mycena floridula]